MRRLTIPLSVLAVLLLAATVTLADDVRVVVGFKDKPDAALLAKYGAKTVRECGEAVAVVVDPKEVAGLRAEANVAFVEEDGIAETVKGKPGGGGSTPPPQALPWGVQRVWDGSATKPSVTGAGVKVAVIDTGIEFAHPDLAANLDADLWANYVDNVSTANDDNGHGTHVAGTIAAVDNSEGVIGVASGATLHAVKVLDRRGSGWLSDVIAGIGWAVNNGMDVANMSLSSSSNLTELESMCNTAKAAGVIIVAAAGNSGDGSLSTSEWAYPAAYASVLAVGATSSTDGLAAFSNTNAYVDLSAPGVSVYSTYKGKTYKSLSGTSMAAPHVAGVIALVWEDMGLSTSAADVWKEMLTNQFDDAGTSGRDNGYGLGIVNYVLVP